jgi:hypothetical protein
LTARARRHRPPRQPSDFQPTDARPSRGERAGASPAAPPFVLWWVWCSLRLCGAGNLGRRPYDDILLVLLPAAVVPGRRGSDTIKNETSSTTHLSRVDAWALPGAVGACASAAACLLLGCAARAAPLGPTWGDEPAASRQLLPASRGSRLHAWRPANRAPLSWNRLASPAPSLLLSLP